MRKNPENLKLNKYQANHLFLFNWLSDPLKLHCESERLCGDQWVQRAIVVLWHIGSCLNDGSASYMLMGGWAPNMQNISKVDVWVRISKIASCKDRHGYPTLYKENPPCEEHPCRYLPTGVEDSVNCQKVDWTGWWYKNERRDVWKCGASRWYWLKCFSVRNLGHARDKTCHWQTCWSCW